MKIRLFRIDNHYYAAPTLMCEGIGKNGFAKGIMLLADTGASITTIWNYIIGKRAERLPASPDITITANGMARSKVLKDATLVFKTQTGKNVAETLDRLDVLTAAIRAPFDGLLGMDLLDRFSMRHTSGRSFSLQR